MDLLEILNKILVTKNEIKDILSENDNIARYSVTIHNKLAKLYNAAWREGYHDRWYTLTGKDRWLDGPQNQLDYTVNYTHYDKFTTEILTDIMRDVLNYRLIMKDEMNVYVEPDIADNFEQYPDYLNGIIEQVQSIGLQDGKDAADEAYEGTSEVEIPVFIYGDNTFSITTSQTEALIYFSLGENGVPTLYTGPVIISESEDIYYWAKLGRSESPKQIYSDPEITESGNIAFAFPPDIYQDNNKLYISTSTSGASIQYSIDGGDWNVYYGPVLVTASMSNIKAMCVKNNEYSKYNSLSISHDIDIDSLRPANVYCTFTPTTNGANVTLTCTTENARIFYSVDEADGYYREYSDTFEVEKKYFIIYVYSLKDGYSSKMKLVYRYGANSDTTVPADVQFIEEGTKVTLYCTTSGSKVWYRKGAVGSYTEGSSNAVTLNLSERTDLYAYSVKDNVNSKNITTYTYWPNGNTTEGKPAKPVIIQENNTITISSDFEVRYTLDQSDPRSYGITYNPALGITIAEFTVIKAAAINRGVYSDVTTKSCSYYDEVGGGSGSDNNGQNPGNGADTDELFVDGNWFSIKGITAVSFEGTLYYAAKGYPYWRSSGSQVINGLNMNVKYFFKGNVSKFTGFTGQAVIAGDVSTVKGNAIGKEDLNYSGLFRGCTNLVNASGITVNISNMPNGMMQDMFNGCTDLREAAFTINTDTVSENGMTRMFYGCSKLEGGPVYDFETVKSFGMSSTFQDCIMLASTGNLNLISAGSSAFISCFKNCRSLTSIRIQTPTGTALQRVFSGMFEGCTSLEDVHNSLFRYEAMGTSSCERMFYGCSSLKNIFPLTASELAESCYLSMFENCTSLMTAPVISATTLARNCMNSMFKGCTNLRTAPDLDVENVSGMTSCYSNMFENCNSLCYIKAMFKNTPNGSFSSNWVRNVAAEGTFVVNREANWLNGSNAFGVNAIPTGWTVVGAAVVGKINDIWSQDGYCYISASNGDEIWYQVTDNAPVTDTQYLTNRYTEPFKLYRECYVSAACKNSDGVFGSIYSELINPGYPNLVIVQRSGRIQITTGTDFTYDNIQYQICEYGTDNVVSDWTMYTQPFSIDQDRRIKAKGFINGVEVTTTVQDVYYDSTSPVIEFLINYNSDHTSILKIWCNMSYPNPSVCEGLYYKINDNSDDDPDTAPSNWTEYSSAFEVTNYIDATHEKVTVTGIAKISKNGSYIWSSKNKQEMHRGTTEQLADPVFVQISESNNVILEYQNEQYETWNDPDVVIEYKYNLGGNIRQYTQSFNLSDSGAYSEQDVPVYGRTRVGNVMTDWVLYTLHYNPAYVHYEVLDPEVYAELDSSTGKVMIHMNNATENPPYYTVQNYCKIQVTGYDATGLKHSGTYYGQYSLYNNAFELNSHVVKFIVWGKSKLNNDWSNEVSSIEYDIKKDFGIEWDNRPVPQVTVAAADNKVIITCPFDVEPTMYIENTKWGTGAVDETKYDTERLVTVFNLGKTGTGVYSGYLDEHLASGTIYVRYQYEGIWSAYASINYNNSNIQPLVAPSVTCEWDRNKQAYILYVRNNTNEGVILKYRMENCVWSGGVIDTHKYDNPKVAGLYGDTVSEYLIESDIIGITVYDPNNTNQIRESTPLHFINEHYTALPEPQILLIDKTDNDAIKVTNRNKLTTNYWRCRDGVWNPGAVNPHKYDEWMVAFTTDNDLDTDLLSGTIEAYSVWGSENTLDSITTFIYDSGRTINDNPPTVTVTQSTGLYNITITNNADTANFYNLKWKVDEIEWNPNTNESCSAGNYQKTAGDGYCIENKVNSFTFTIGTDIMTGKIMAFYTNETNNLQVYNRTPVTIIDFTNALIS